MSDILNAPYTGVLELGNVQIACAVLDDQEHTRVLSERSIIKAIGGKRGGAHWRRRKTQLFGTGLPIYASAPALQPFIDKDLMEVLTSPIRYRAPSSGGIANGVKAIILPKICEVWLKARENKVLRGRQNEIAKKAEILTRGLAHVGIIALVDEATGFHLVRDRLSLVKILEKFINKELLPWTKRFPDVFYIELFRLRGWQWKGMKVNRPQYVGKLTNDLVYERLAPGVLQELQRVTPRDDKGRTKHRYHQRLTVDVGHPELDKLLHTIVHFMLASANWGLFYRMVQRSLPRQNEQLPLPLTEEE